MSCHLDAFIKILAFLAIPKMSASSIVLKDFLLHIEITKFNTFLQLNKSKNYSELCQTLFLFVPFFPSM